MDYDSARHHFEALQTAKKKDETKIAKVKQTEGCATVLSFGKSAFCLMSRCKASMYHFTGYSLFRGVLWWGLARCFLLTCSILLEGRMRSGVSDHTHHHQLGICQHHRKALTCFLRCCRTSILYWNSMCPSGGNKALQYHSKTCQLVCFLGLCLPILKQEWL